MINRFDMQGDYPGGQNGGNSPGNQNGNQNGSNGNGNNGQDPRKQNFMLLVLAVLVTILIVSFFMRSINGSTHREISYNEFIKMMEEDRISSVRIESDRVEITPKGAENTNNLYYGSVTYYTGKVEDDETLTARLLEHGIEVNGEVQDSSGILLSILLTYILPILLLWFLFSRLSRHLGGGDGIMGMGVGKSRAKVYVQKETGVTFADVAGADEAKESLVEVVDFLHNPGRYAKIGARLPKGALLVGPPGTGKTLLARAVAGEAHVPFFSLTGSDFIELYVGVGASRVRDLFKEAEKNAPCIVFIDEIDAIGRSRDSKYGGGNEEREQTLNQLLSEMDGFDAKKGIMILAATNRPEILDKALLRPGRFDRRIIVDKPDLKGREEILRVHAKSIHMDETADLHAIALATSGAVGSDLANMINESAINAVKDGRNAVSQRDLFNAVEQVLVGKEKKDRVLSEKEKKIVAYHETGHALIAALQKNSEPVQKITIVPRTMGALGYVMQVPEEEKYLDTAAELHDRLVGLLGGRAAEDVVFDTVTTGVANDIEKATTIARAMVTQYGMSKKFGLIGLQRTESRYLDGRTVLDCSDVTEAEIDEEVMKILKEAYKEAKKLLKENRKLLDRLAAHLIERESITGREFMEIYRKERGLPEVEENREAAIVRESMEKAGVYGGLSGDKGESGSSSGNLPSGQSTPGQQVQSGNPGPQTGMPQPGNQNYPAQPGQNYPAQPGQGSAPGYAAGMPQPGNQNYPAQPGQNYPGQQAQNGTQVPQPGMPQPGNQNYPAQPGQNYAGQPVQNGTQVPQSGMLQPGNQNYPVQPGTQNYPVQPGQNSAPGQKGYSYREHMDDAVKRQQPLTPQQAYNNETRLPFMPPENDTLGSNHMNPVAGRGADPANGADGDATGGPAVGAGGPVSGGTATGVGNPAAGGSAVGAGGTVAGGTAAGAGNPAAGGPAAGAGSAAAAGFGASSAGQSSGSAGSGDVSGNQTDGKSGSGTGSGNSGGRGVFSGVADPDSK